ncbi:MAG: hypothetical protein WD810_00295 [Solirubrobacterales bacterium]
MTEPQQTTPPLGSPGEPCRSCGAALAADQRYCLNCGERRGGPRVDDYRRHLNGHATAAAPPAGEPQAKAPSPAAALAAGEEKRQRDYAPLAAAGGIAVLGVMLLIGVLIGRGTGATTTATPAPQVVTVGAEADDSQTAGDSRQESQGERRASGKSSGKGSNLAAGNSGGAGDAAVASEDDLKELQEQSPEEYQDSSAKLPDEIATPGKAPPTDDKAPGGGSGGTTIE